MIHLNYDEFKDLDKGLQLIEKAMQLAPDLPDPVFNLAIAHAKKGNKQQATELAKAVEDHPGARPALKEMAKGLIKAI